MNEQDILHALRTLPIDTDSYESCLACAVSSGTKSGRMESMDAQRALVFLLLHLFLPGIIAPICQASQESMSDMRNL